MKNIGIDNDVPIDPLALVGWRAEAKGDPVETKVIKGRSIRAKFLVDPTMDSRMQGTFWWDEGQLIIVTREAVVEESGDLAEIAALHEDAEASAEYDLSQRWDYRLVALFRFIPAVAKWQKPKTSARRAYPCGRSAVARFGNAWHLDQLERMSKSELTALIHEDRAYTIVWSNVIWITNNTKNLNAWNPRSSKGDSVARRRPAAGECGRVGHEESTTSEPRGKPFLKIPLNPDRSRAPPESPNVPNPTSAIHSSHSQFRSP